MTRVAIELGEPGARLAARRGDVVVLIDALRASVTITCALYAGASRVIPVRHVDEAKVLTTQYGYLSAGERGGAPVPGFDFGNSPTEMLANRERLNGRTLVLTTSNGTRCAQAAVHGGAGAVLCGALPNADVVVQAAWETAARLGCDITLLAAGLDDQMAIEDSFSARCLLQRLADRFGPAAGHQSFDPVDPADSVAVFETSEAGMRVAGLSYSADVAYCAQIDVLPVVPEYRAETGFVLWASGMGTKEETGL